MHDYFFVFLLIFCDFPLCYKIFGTIDYSISLFGNFERPMEGIILVVQMHTIIFTLVDIPRGTALRYILHIFAHLCFFLRSCIFWEPFSCFISIFDRCSWYFLEAYLIKGIFSKHLLFCWETSEVILQGFILGYAPLFLKAVSFYLMKLCIDVFYVTLTFPSKEFQSTYPSAGSIMQYFGAYFKYVNILPILCMNAMILLWSPSVLCIFGCFESIL